LTRGFTGRLARGIHNRLMEELNRKETETLPYPLQRGLVRNLSITAEAAGRADILPLWAGQSANLSACTDASAFFHSLVEEVSEIGEVVIDGTGTNPEQLFAAGWSACFISAMGLVANKMKVKLPADVAIDAEIDLCNSGDVYFL
jgi:OsmC-like protein